MKSVSIDIMNLLAANGLGAVGTNLFAMAWNEEVDAQTVVIDGEGFNTTLKDEYENPVFRILVRGSKGDDMNTAYTAIRAVHEFLIVQPTQIIDGTEYLQYEPLSTIMTLGRDDNDRAVFSINYYTFRNPV